MKWMKWLPWRFVIRYAARAHGFLDPIALLGRLHHFAQPSEINEPIELLRAGVVLHARGLINSRVIQHNLDWLWPFWVERQFNPHDDAFIPRAFSLTHINLTHRNWTAIGIPDCDELPIVGPRGLLTPFLDQWSIDCWIITTDGRSLLPARSSECIQRLCMDDGLSISTEFQHDGLSLEMRAHVEEKESGIACMLQVDAKGDTEGWLVMALRPFNPEGISFVHTIALASDRSNWSIDGHKVVWFGDRVDQHRVSHYKQGDVFLHLLDRDEKTAIECPVGMATAAALFSLRPDRKRRVVARIPLIETRKKRSVSHPSWQDALADTCQLRIPDQRFQFLYDAALRSLILHSPDDVYPGPYTYKRFWFRDAAFIIHGLLCSGFFARAERAIDRFPARQRSGYFHSQEGEWDANGEVLWIMRRFCELSGRIPKSSWRSAILQGGRWIVKKRLTSVANAPHAGLMPPGFSAEHLGPNDYYYWDDFWGISGLQAAAYLAEALGERQEAEGFREDWRAFSLDVDKSLQTVRGLNKSQAMPASPYRRLDAGAIGSIVAGYPLMLWPADDRRLLDTIDFLLDNCFVHGGFFQDMIHSGINAYLTLHIAQVLLRSGDSRYYDLMAEVARLASPTGQWPEAIHPQTLGGCMGDGQHVWAAAEWVLMMRNCFVREENDGLVLASGIHRSWLVNGQEISFGPAPTSFGRISITAALVANDSQRKIHLRWQGDWHREQPKITVQFPGGAAYYADGAQGRLDIEVDW